MNYILIFILLFFSNFTFANSQNPNTNKSLFQLAGYQKNNGQIIDQLGNLREDVQYIYNEPAFKLILKRNSFSYEVYTLKDEKESFNSLKKNQEVRSARVDIILHNFNKEVEIIEGPQLQFYTNHFIKSNGAIFQSKYFSQITYKNIYNRIDLVFSIADGKPKYDFVIYPGGNADDISLEYCSEKNKVEVLDNQIEINLGDVTLYDKLPISYLISQGNYSKRDLIKEKIDVLYKKRGNKFHFKVDKYDNDKILVIDPAVYAVWGRFFGGENDDTGKALEVDNLDNIYITGSTNSLNNIATSGAFDNTYESNVDAYIAKFDSNGILKWATYFGGNGHDYVWDLALDNLNNIVIVGNTESGDLISTTSTYQKNYNGMVDGFACKFDSSGTLLWSTYYGGQQADFMCGVDIDKFNNIYIIGYTSSINNISSAGVYLSNYQGGTDAFIVKLSPSGSRIWATYFGGPLAEIGSGIALDNNNNVIITGYTDSKTNISSTNAYQVDFGGGNSDSFIGKFNNNGMLIWSTYYGGLGDENNYFINYFGIEVDNSDNIVAVGITNSKDHIASPGAYQISSNSTDGFIVKLTPNGTRLWGTYFGGSGFDGCNKLFIDKSDNVFICGITTSVDKISSICAYNQKYLGGSQDGFVLKLSFDGIKQFSSYIGGSSFDEATDICIDSKNNFIVIGSTNSVDKIATENFISTLNTGRNALLIKLKEYISIPPVISVTSSTQFCKGDSVLLECNNQNSYLWSNGDTTQMIYASRGGNYFVNTIDSFGCSMISDTVLLNQIRPKIYSDDDVICKGNSVVLTSSPGNNYLWSTGESSKSIIISDPGIYTVTNTDSTGCRATSDSISIREVTPVLPYLGNDTTICTGKDLTLSSYVTGAKYGWSTGDTTSSIVVNHEGKYSVNLFYYSCPVVADTILIKNISEFEYSIPNLVTPNNDKKNDGFVFTNILSNSQDILPNTNVFIYNCWGELVYKNLNYNNDWQAEGIPEGIYYYLIKNDHYCMKEYKGWLHILR